MPCSNTSHNLIKDLGNGSLFRSSTQAYTSRSLARNILPITMAAVIKMDELLVSWLGTDDVYENVCALLENYRQDEAAKQHEEESKVSEEDDQDSQSSPRTVVPPFYPVTGSGRIRRRRRTPVAQQDTWEPLHSGSDTKSADAVVADTEESVSATNIPCVRDQVTAVFLELGQDPLVTSSGSSTASDPDDFARKYVPIESFGRITKEICRFPSFFNGPLYQRILDLWNADHHTHAPILCVSFAMLEWFWMTQMEPYDEIDRFFNLIKAPDRDYIIRDDFLPFTKALLADHPGLEFLSSHQEFQEKYAITVITRIFYVVNRSHSGRITSRQIRRSDLLEAFQQVDEEEDINKVTRYFSYEHFYVLYCRFWELDHDRDYRITREDLLKYGDHSLSHMIVDRIFEAAPRPFENDKVNREFISYEDFIYFMLSEEDKSNEISVRYWFTCVDVDGDSKLNNMEMRSFYAVQLHRMQCMGHEVVPFEDMLCQMMDMIKPANTDHVVAEDFLQPECKNVSGALFDALFNLNKYLMFEQRDPFAERQKREDEFECDWDRFACMDYNRLAMEEEVREEEAMEIDWVTVDDDDDGEDDDDEGFAAQSGGMTAGTGSNEAPF